MAEEKELREITTPFEVLDALGGLVSEDYKTDVKLAEQLGVTFSKSLYEDACQMNAQP